MFLCHIYQCHQFTFWYPVMVEKQVDFEGHIYENEVVLDGHIIYNGILMCGESREVVRKSVRAEKEKKVSKRVPKTMICPKCVELYRNHPDSAYYRFAHGKPPKLVSVEKISKDVPNETKTQKELASSLQNA